MLLIIQYNQDFTEQHAEKQEMSQDYLRFLNVMETTTKMQDGKYCVNLSFMTMNVCLPNNVAVAKHRLQVLKRSFRI